MIHFTKGNIITSSAEALVNTVNTVGVMGKGIALQFKEEFPKNFLSYKVACSSGELTPGKLLITKELNSNGEEKIIINFPTKLHWRNPSKYEYITEGLKDLTKAISEHNIKSIAIPPVSSNFVSADFRKMRTDSFQKSRTTRFRKIRVVR